MYGGYEGQDSYEYPYSHGNPKHIEPEKVDEYVLSDYGWTAETIKAYMYGVRVVDPETGEEMGDTFYNHIIEVAVDKAEKELDIAILPRRESEHHDYNQTEFSSYMYTHVHKKPILQVDDLKLEMNGRAIYRYPANWWKVYCLAGHIELYPTALMQTSQSMTYDSVFGGYPQLAGTAPSIGRTYAPQMIHVEYVAGMLPRKRAGVSRDWEVPAALEQLVTKYALVEIFQVWGRLIIGAGIASRTLVYDGVSESIDTTQSAMYTGSAADIELINKDIDSLVAQLRSHFGINMIGL
ncbi:hypothetical protein [Listeria virus P61]|nr:hypothetical protein [Listeria virus P61]